MIEGIDVVFIHSPYKELADWYADVLGLQPGYSDGQWTEFQTRGVTRFAIEHAAYPRSVVENQSIMISFRVSDNKRAVTSLAEHGVRFHPSPQEVLFGLLRCVYHSQCGYFHRLSIAHRRVSLT